MYIYVDSHGKVATQPLHNFSQNTFRPFKSSHSNPGPAEQSAPSDWNKVNVSAKTKASLSSNLQGS